MDFLKKIQSLPESRRKIILWTVTCVVALTLFAWWIRGVKVKVENFPKEQVKESFTPPDLPSLEVPAPEIPEISEEELRQLQEQLKADENGKQ